MIKESYNLFGQDNFDDITYVFVYDVHETYYLNLTPSLISK